MARAAPVGETEVGAVFLDMDDTIFDHSLTCRAAIGRLRRRTPFLQHRPLRELWEEYLVLLDRPTTGRLRTLSSSELRARRWRLLARSCGAELSAEQAEALSREYRGLYQEERRAVPGAVPLVRRLRSVASVAIVTNNEVAEQEEKLRFLGLVDAVDALVVSEAVGVAKPDRGIFDQALGRIGVAPPDAVMVGDSWTSDVLGARGLGVRPVWFNRFRFPSPGGELVDELASFLPSSEATGVLLGTAARAGPGGVGSRRGR